MSWNTRRAILLLLIVLGYSGLVFAASQNAVIYGTVYNVSSNPMPDVTVVLENKALGITRTAVTGSDGSYTFTEVPPADNYSVTAKQGGRTLDTRTGVTVNVGDERVILPPLTEQPAVAAGTGGEVKPVKPRGGATPTVRNETISTTISGVVTGEQLRQLPLYNRNFLVLGLITPNVHDTEPGSALAGASFSVAGARPTQNSFLLDGADNVASSSNQAIPFQVNDSIQEFRVTSSTANAEYGRNLGGTVNVVTKRAGNQFHGSAYGYFANDALNSDSPLSVYNNTTFKQAAAYAGPVNATAATGVTNPQFLNPFSYNQYVANAVNNGFTTNYGATDRFSPATILATHNSFTQPFDSKQFGASAGGALVKDKWFAFGSYEGTRIDNPNPILERVPTSADVAHAASGATADYLLAQKALGLFPASNINTAASGAVPGVLEFYQGEAPNYTHVHNFLVRSDYKKSENSDFTLRYVGQFLNQLHDDSLPAVGSYPGNGAFRDAVNQSVSLSFSHNFTKSLINELRLSFSRFDVSEAPQDASFNATTLGLPTKQMPTILLNGIDTQSSGAAPGVNGAFTGWSDVGVTATSMYPWADTSFPFARLGAPLGAPSERRDSTYSASDNVAWNKGHHNVKFGGEFRHLDNDVFDGALNRGLVYSGNIGEFTSDSESCNVGLPACGANNAFQRPSFDFAQSNPAYSGKFSSYALAGYIQDTYRARKNLTFNYGVRYEFFSVPHEINNNIWNFDPSANGLVQQNGTAIMDPYGNVCGSTDPAWGILPSHFGGFKVQDSFSNPTWTSTTGCKSTPSVAGYNQIAHRNALNFAPRVGIAWNVRGDEVAHPTVIRFGWGIFYDQAPINQISQLMYNQPITAPNAILGQAFSGDPTVPLAVCGGANYQCGLGNTGAFAPASLPFSAIQQPYSIYARDTVHSATPRSMQVSATIQQQLSPKVTAEAGYVGMIGYWLPTVYDQNFANEWGHVRQCAGGAGSATCPTGSGSALWFDNMSQFPIFTMTNRGDSNYHSVMARMRLAGWHGLRVNAAYSFSKSLDNSSTGLYPTVPITPRNLLLSQYLGTGFYPSALLLGAIQPGFVLAGSSANSFPVFPTINFATGALTTTGAGQVLVSPYQIAQDPFNFLSNDYGLSDFNSKHRATVDYAWETKSSSKLWDMWTFSGIFTAQSGQPFSIFGGPIAGAMTQRAELGVLPSQLSITDNPNEAIDPSQFVFLLGGFVCPRQVVANNASTFMPVPGEACIGRTGRNAFIGPNLINMNFSVQKGFNVGGESKKLYFRAEFFNLFDRSNFYNPVSSISANGFTPSDNFGQILSAHDPRQIQLAVRFSW